MVDVLFGGKIGFWFGKVYLMALGQVVKVVYGPVAVSKLAEE